MTPNAVSIPCFICRPSSRAGPENGAAMPNRISSRVTPWAEAAGLAAADAALPGTAPGT